MELASPQPAAFFYCRFSKNGLAFFRLAEYTYLKRC